METRAPSFRETVIMTIETSDLETMNHRQFEGNPVDIHQLELFCKIADLKSFSRAAESVSLTQPTASGHIKNLEVEFGVRLFDRLGREVALTEAGKILYDSALRIIALCQEAQDAMQEFAGAGRGALRLGASSIPGDYLLPRVLGAFKKAYPETKISLKIEDSEVISRMVLEGAVELGIVGAKMDESRLMHEVFGTDELILVLPPDHAWAHQESVSVADLKTQPFLHREEGSGTRKILERRLAVMNFEPGELNTVVELGSNEGIREAVKAGIGISILSKLAVQSDLDAGLLAQISVEGVNLERELFLVRHKSRYRTPVCKRFQEFLREIL